jgi:tRNA1(Val) A37 N6-methylase TrmN6
MRRAAAAVTRDALLGGRVTLVQPARGYRAAIDAVFLAAAVPAAPGDRVLDAGAGAGAAALCLAARAPDVEVVGVEMQKTLVRFAAEGAALSGLARRVRVLAGDILAPPQALRPATFDHVMANPPFVERGRGTRAAVPGKALAATEGAATLEDWAAFCCRMARPKGSVTFIHRADRLDAMLAALKGKLGGIVVFPLWPGPLGPMAAGRTGRPAKSAKRVLVQGRKGIAAPLTLAAGLVLHRPDGRFTAAAEAVLRGGRALLL